MTTHVQYHKETIVDQPKPKVYLNSILGIVGPPKSDGLILCIRAIAQNEVGVHFFERSLMSFEIL